jgi:hypothetical protein
VSDTDHAGALIQRGGPSLDQVVLVHLGGSLPTPPGQGVRVRFRGGLVPYGDQETAAFHEAVARAGGQRYGNDSPLCAAAHNGDYAYFHIM